MKRSTKIFSIFGQIEDVAAKIMIKDGKAKKIAFEHIPAEVAFNKDGQKARYAISVNGDEVAAFEKLL